MITFRVNGSEVSRDWAERVFKHSLQGLPMQAYSGQIFRDAMLFDNKIDSEKMLNDAGITIHRPVGRFW